jgi:hypothetical protein
LATSVNVGARLAGTSGSVLMRRSLSATGASRACVAP